MAETDDKSPNYTNEMVTTAVSMYEDLGNDGLDQIAEAIGKNVRSVRSKLVREGVYMAAPKQATKHSPQGRSTVLLRKNCCGILSPMDLMFLGSKVLLRQL